MSQDTQNITSSEELRATILQLELDQKKEGVSLKKEIHVVYQELQPINIIKNTVKLAVQSRDLKDDLINASVGMALGYVSKSLFEGETHSPARKLMGTALMFGVSNAVTNNPEFVKAVGVGFINLFKSSIKKEDAKNGEEVISEN